MPSGYLHLTCAIRAMERAGLSGLSREAFILGAHGPDPLFTLGIFPLRFSSKPLPYGKALHTTRTGAHLMALLERAKGAGIAQRSFAMGFLTHYALDSTVHPYVYAHSDDPKKGYSSALHMRLEKQWDALYHRRDGGRGTPYAMPGISEAKPFWPAVAALWQSALAEAYPELSITADALLKAFSDAERAGRLTHSGTGIKYAAVWCLERLLGRPALLTSQMTPRFVSRKDIENSAHRTWRAKSEPLRERTEGLSELFEMAVERAAALLLFAERYFRDELSSQALAEAIGNVGYDTGMTLDV